jgi:hypothetical protein
MKLASFFLQPFLGRMLHALELDGMRRGNLERVYSKS